MTQPRDPLRPADVVVVGDVTIVPDAARPVAAVVVGGASADSEADVRWATWPDAPLGDHAPGEAQVVPAPTGAWVVYRPEVPDDAPSAAPGPVAVHVGLDAAVTVVALGDRHVLGADQDGLWLGDARDAFEWSGRLPFEGDDDPGDGDVAEGGSDGVEPDPETLPWVPEAPFWPEAGTADDEEARADTRHRAPDDPALTWSADDDSDSDDRDDDSVVATYGWFLTAGSGDDARALRLGPDGIEFLDHPDDPDGPDGPVVDAEPPSPTPSTVLVLVRTDGSRTDVRVDRLADGVRREGDELVVRFHPTGPRQVASRWGGWDVVYEPREVRVDVSAGLPEEIVTVGAATEPAPERDPAAWEREEELRESARASWSDRLDLAGVDGARWAPWGGDEAARASAVARLTAVFEGLGEPVVLWTRDHPGLRRAPSEYRDVRVEVVGEWPDAELVVSLEHRSVPHLRLRRRYRVSDETGRPLEWQYVTVHLDEDVATALPPRSQAVDGVLDI